MNKIFKSTLVFLALFFSLAVSGVSAETRTSEGGTINVAKTEVINDDLFVAAQTAVIDGTVNGDVFVGAQTVTINGIINGNLHVGANSVTITGKISGNSYIGAGNISINAATFGGSLIMGSGNIDIAKGTAIAGSVMAGAGNISIDSKVGRNVYIGAGSATIGADAVVAKNLYYQVGGNGNVTDINIVPGAKISGGVYKSTPQFTPSPKVTEKQTAKAFSAIDSSAKLVGFLGSLIIGFLYYKLFSKHFEGSANTLTKSFWKSFGIGFLIIVATVPALIIMAITIVGLPLAGVSLLVLCLGLYLAKIVVGFSLGKWIALKFNWKKLSTFWVMTLGLFIIYILKVIPVVGWLSSMVVVWSGLGALAIRTFSREKSV